MADPYREEARPGWVRPCPSCGTDIRFTVVTIWNAPQPFFYCEGGIDVLMRDRDKDRADDFIARKIRERKMARDSQLEAVWLECLETAPPCPGGGRFALWANFHCPECKQEIPYNGGVRDLHLRLHDQKVIVVDGAVVVGDSPEKSWRAKIDPVQRS